MSPRPTRLLTQNRRLREFGVWNWTLPAWAGKFSDTGQNYNTCPSAGVCSQVCYARAGAYLWPAVRRKHEANLRFVLEDLRGWQQAMTAELGAHRFHRRWVRVHDSGDFFTDLYTQAWLTVMRARPEVSFYAYTKEVDRFRRIVTPDPPPNFRWAFSLGGTQDALLDPRVDRVADVFPTEEAITEAGWHSQQASDLLAVLGPAPVGMSANRIPAFLKRQGDRRFSQWQAQVDANRAARDRPRRSAASSPEATPRTGGRT